MFGTLCLTAFGSLAGSAGCHREIVAPDQDMVALSQVSVSNACTQVRFRLSGNFKVTVTMPDSSCGSSPFRIVSGGTPIWKKNPDEHLTIPIRVVNQDSVPYSIPRLKLPHNGGMTVIDPEGSPCCLMHAFSPDTTVLYVTKTWNLYPDTTAGAPADTLRPGSTTAVRTLEFRIRAPVLEGRFNYDIVAQRLEELGDTIRPPLPDTTSWPTTALLVTPPYDTTLRYYRDVFGVIFDDTTSGVGVNAFLNHFSATIIGGGFHGYDTPQYIVRIPDPGNSWGIVDSMGLAMDEWPGVYSAGPICNVCKLGIRGRYPIDGSSAPSRNAWRDSTNLDLWAWRAIRAPLAWGCETGIYDQNRVEMAIIDMIFHPDDISGDLTSSLAAGGGVRVPPARDLVNWNDPLGYVRTEHHGQAGAGVMTATGDNGQGIAGMVWGSRLTAYAFGAFANNQPKQPINAVEVLGRHLKHAGDRGVRVVNLSFGAGTSFDRSEVKAARKAMKKYLNGSPSRMLVIATGNDTNPTVIAGTISRASLAVIEHRDVQATDRIAAELLGDPAYRGKILFVTGVNRQGGRWKDSLGGANIWKDADLVAAPAEGVLSTRGTAGEGTDVFAGTSIAAPFVSGLAAQLWAMKPTLTAAQVKDYILRGAATSPTTPAHMDGFQGIFRIDAYNSLKLVAAENPQTPLCGNRVFLDGQNRVVAQRSSPTNLEVIWQGTSAADSIRAVYPYHGGRRVGFYSDVLGDQDLTFASGSWSPVPWTASPSWALGGSWYSMRRTTHDGDSTVWTTRVLVPGGERVDVSMSTNNLLTTRPLASIPISLALQTGNFEPSRRSAQYDSSGQFTGWSYHTPHDISNFETIHPSGGWAQVRGVPSPMQDRVFVLVNRFTVTFQGWSDWFPSDTIVKDGEFTAMFRSAGFRTASQRAEIYSIPWSGGSYTLVRSANDSTIERMGVSEDGTEIVVALGRFGSGTWPVYPYAGCDIQYWSATSLFGLKNRFPTVLHVCNWFNENAGGFAAVIAGGALDGNRWRGTGSRATPVTLPERRDATGVPRH